MFFSVSELKCYILLYNYLFSFSDVIVYILLPLFFSVTYEGDNFVRFSGDTQKMAQTQSKINAIKLNINIEQYEIEILFAISALFLTLSLTISLSTQSSWYMYHFAIQMTAVGKTGQQSLSSCFIFLF